MSYLLDIFNKRQPAPQMSAPQQMQRPMAMPSGGPNTGAPLPSAPSFDIQSATLPPMDVATAIAFGMPPSQINRGPGGNAQNNPMPPMGGGMPAFNLPPDFSVGGPQQMPAPNFGMGGVSQMPAFQPPQPMPFNNRPMPQYGAPNFSLQGGMTAAPQPSPMTGMMKGMFGVR
jgi:hypothetical protein